MGREGVTWRRGVLGDGREEVAWALRPESRWRFGVWRLALEKMARKNKIKKKKKKTNQDGSHHCFGRREATKLYPLSFFILP